MTKTEERTAQKQQEKADNRKRQEKKQSSKVERDNKLILINLDFDSRIDKIQAERQNALKKVWDDWNA